MNTITLVNNKYTRMAVIIYPQRKEKDRMPQRKEVRKDSENAKEKNIME